MGNSGTGMERWTWVCVCVFVSNSKQSLFPAALSSLLELLVVFFLIAQNFIFGFTKTKAGLHPTLAVLAGSCHKVLFVKRHTSYPFFFFTTKERSELSTGIYFPPSVFLPVLTLCISFAFLVSTHNFFVESPEDCYSLCFHLLTSSQPQLKICPGFYSLPCD